MGSRAGAALLGGLALACGASRTPVSEAPPLALEARAVRNVVALALDLDVAASPAADTLIDPGAVIIANGRERSRPPRFAAVEPGGILTITTVHVELAPGGLAWAFAVYRWTGEDRNAEVGAATIVLKRRAGGWKITHAHSSQQLPWQ